MCLVSINSSFLYLFEYFVERLVLEMSCFVLHLFCLFGDLLCQVYSLSFAEFIEVWLFFNLLCIQFSFLLIHLILLFHFRYCFFIGLYQVNILSLSDLLYVFYWLLYVFGWFLYVSDFCFLFFYMDHSPPVESMKFIKCIGVDILFLLIFKWWNIFDFVRYFSNIYLWSYFIGWFKVILDLGFKVILDLRVESVQYIWSKFYSRQNI